MPAIDAADASFAFELAQTIERKREIRIGVNTGVIERFAAMRIDERVYIDIARDRSEREIASLDPSIERGLAPLDEPAR